MVCIIDQGSALDCTDPPIGGVNNFVMRYNYPDWRTLVDGGFVTRDANGMIVDIVNAPGLQAYRFDIPDETALILGSPDRLVDGGLDGYDHNVSSSILNIKQDQKNIVKGMSFTKHVDIVYRKNGTGEVYGDEQGLKPTTNTYNPNDPSVGTVIPIQSATSPRTGPENRMPADIFKTDIPTTKALIEGLNVIGV